MINKNLLNFDFYKNSISLFLKQSYGILNRAQNLFEILMNVNGCCDDIFDRLNIFYYESESENYITKYTTNNGNDETCVWLDLIGSYLGISRTLIVKNFKNQNEKITLNDKEFLTFIEAVIEKYSFDGTLENIWNVYNARSITENPYNIDSLKRTSFLSELNIVYTTPKQYNNVDVSATCNVYLTGASHNLSLLFYNGYLTAQCVGIKYNYVI